MDGNLNHAQVLVHAPSPANPSSLRQSQAIAEAESDFLQFARENYEPCAATARQALDELSDMALMAKEIAAFTRQLMARRAKLDMALSYERDHWRGRLAADPDAVSECITDAIDLGEGGKVLRLYVEREMRSQPA